MKKILTVLTIVALVASSAFAGFSGEASVTAGANLDNGNFGFLDNGNNVKLDVELSTAEGSAQGEGDIYASIKASLGIKVFNGEKGTGFSGDPQWLGFGVIAKLDEAKIGGENWYVSIKGMPDGPDYASSAIDTYDVKKTVDKWGFTKADYTKNASVGVPYASTNGVEVGVMGFKAGVGVRGDYNKGDDWKLEDSLEVAAFVETPEFDFSGLKLQAAGVYSYDGFGTLTDGVVDNADFTGKTNALGGSVKVGFENDAISATVASDLGVKFPVKEGDKAKFDADVAANFTYDFIAVDAYYGTNPVTGETQKMATTTSGGVTTEIPVWGKTDKSYTKDLLSAQVKFDLNSFDVPVAITVGAKDVINTCNFNVKADVTVVEGLTLTAKAGYTINTLNSGLVVGEDADGNLVTFKKTAESTIDFLKDAGVFLGQWNVGLDAEYAFDYATVKGGVSLKNLGAKAIFDSLDTTTRAFAGFNDFDYGINDLERGDVDSLKKQVNKLMLGVSASVETEKLIPGATLSLTWSDGVDLLKVYTKKADGSVTNFGSITAKCKIAF